VFFDPEFIASAERAGYEIIEQLRDPARAEALRSFIPERWRAPGQGEAPTFAVLDFAAAREGDRIVPRLIELQGFPSLLAFSAMQTDAWNAALAGIDGLPQSWSSRHGLTREAARELGRRTIVDNADPRMVALVDLDPPHQKTLCDFVATKRLFDVDAVDIRALRRRGNKLYRPDASGAEVPVERIFYRMVIDEVERTGCALPFDLREDLDVAWTPHPNWFWLWSKASLPYLDHPAVPKTRLLSALTRTPRDLDGYVLKPLFSFAGGGVNVAPRASDLDAIPPADYGAWCIQEKVEYGGVIPATDGGDVKLEVRLMYLRPDNERVFTLAQNLCRLSRGSMIGVDYNRDRTWVGSSVGISPDEPR